MLHWIRSKWRARQRAADLHILWPLIREGSDFDHAAATFMCHAAIDTAWEGLSIGEIRAMLAAREEDRNA